MRKMLDGKMSKIVSLIAVCLCFISVILPCKVYATDTAEDNNIYEYVNPATGYRALIEDKANLLDDSE